MPRFPVVADQDVPTPSDRTPGLDVFYLHGFASSPRSAKATFFGERLRARGVRFHCRDFNEPAFETLTISRILTQLDEDLVASRAARVALIGSSLGGLAAWLAAGRWSSQPTLPWRLERMLLLAPAFEFGGNRARELGEGGAIAWRETGWREFYHYATGERRRVHYGLYEDALRHDPLISVVTVPTLVFQGEHDAQVSPAFVQQFAASRPNIDLRMVDDDHQLVRSLETIWEIGEPWLLAGRAR